MNFFSESHAFGSDETWECYFLKNYKLQNTLFTAPYEEIGKTERVPMKISCSGNYSFSGDFKSPYGVVDMFEFKPRPIPMIYPMENVKFSVVKKGENFIELDAGRYVTAKPSFEVAKGDGVKIIYSECYVFDGEKGIHDDSDGEIEGYFDFVHAQDRDFCFELFWLRSFRYMAMRHADSTIKNHVRADGSVNHIVKYNSLTGEVLDVLGGQGYTKGSAWSRGQAWALYGFILSYIHTGKQEYLDTAKKCANYFIASVCEKWFPKADFRAPQNPVVYDSSAGACAASGLLEIADCLGETEGHVYLDAAKKLLTSMEKHFCNWDVNFDSILQYASEAYSVTSNISLIYGDYFFIEAISKLKSRKILFW